jgi:hypothetical protein
LWQRSWAAALRSSSANCRPTRWCHNNRMDFKSLGESTIWWSCLLMFLWRIWRYTWSAENDMERSEIRHPRGTPESLSVQTHCTWVLDRFGPV